MQGDEAGDEGSGSGRSYTDDDAAYDAEGSGEEGSGVEGLGKIEYFLNFTYHHWDYNILKLSNIYNWNKITIAILILLILQRFTL